MATWSRTYSNGSFYPNWHLDLDYFLNSQDSGANTSNITLNLYTYADSGAYSQNGTWDPRIYINGGQVAGSGQSRTITGSGRVLMASWTGNVGHNGDGTLTINIGDYMNAPVNEATFAQTGWTLPQIQRAAVIDGFNINSTTDEGINFSWHADRACDNISWWSSLIDGGAHHDSVASGQGWWGVDLHNLVSGRSYDITVAVRNAASGIWTNSSPQSTTTKAQNNFIGRRGV